MKKYIILAVSLFLFSCVSDGNQGYDESNGGVVEVREMNYFDSDDNGEKVPMEEVEMASLSPIKGSSYSPEPTKKVTQKAYKNKPRKNYRRQLIQGDKLYVQAGAFNSKRNARRMLKRVSGIGNPIIKTSNEGRSTLYKVLFQVSNTKEGKSIISKLKKMGHKSFMIKR